MTKQNRLVLASSPYLRQHADNPVDWYEWGEEALQKAKTENKPLLISIGYAACHWCHVMAHESFSDQNIAAYMNDNFVCVKVDREERPDIDQIYMEAAQLITGRGGWPLNAFALPDGRPFYAGTYFPMSQWLDVLQQLHSVYVTDFPRVLKAAGSITNGLNTNPFVLKMPNFDHSVAEYHQTYENHIKSIDFQFGGYRKAPKFMMPTGLEFLLQYNYLTGNEKALEAVTVSLNAMAQGGIYDQIGGGFARYSTDDNWIVPHFEKMLYDNAQLISLYSKGYQVTKNPFYKEIVEQTIEFVERELLAVEGGFYASIDADSEHEEGKFYVWTKSEIESSVGLDNLSLILDFYTIKENGNWEDGKNILYLRSQKEQFSKNNGLELSQFEEIIQKANFQLFQARSKRIRPTTDDKILCSWNALMISGYVNAFKAFNDESYLKAAIRTAHFIEKYFLSTDGSLYRVYKDGKVSTNAFLDDYALLTSALIDLYESTFDFQWLNKSKLLTQFVWEHFGNDDKSMFFYTSDLSESLVARKFEYSDNVIPASNSVLAHVFFKIGNLFQQQEFTHTALKMIAKVKDEIIEFGSYYANWALLLGRITSPEIEVAIVGEDSFEKAREVQKNYLPTCLFAGGNIENLSLLENRVVKNKTLLYVCKDKSCNLPVESVSEAIQEILEVGNT